MNVRKIWEGVILGCIRCVLIFLGYYIVNVCMEDRILFCVNVNKNIYLFYLLIFEDNNNYIYLLFYDIIKWYFFLLYRIKIFK